MAHRSLFSGFALALAASLCLTSGWFVAQEAGPQVRSDSASGLQTATFQTPQGKIVVNLPDDLMAGDTISGTVIAEPNPVRDKNDPKAQEQYAKDEGELSGFVVEIQSQKASPKDAQTRLTLPPDAKSVPVILKNKNGVEVAKAEIPLALPPTEKAQGTPPAVKPTPGKLDKQGVPTIPNLESFDCHNKLHPAALANRALTQAVAQPSSLASQQPHFQLPTVAVGGRPTQICGTFDGNSKTTAVNIGGKAVRVLAESPRKAVFESPKDVVGTSDIELTKNGVQTKGTFHNLGLKLSAGQLTLKKGEQTTMNVTVVGLEGMSDVVPLTLQNNSPTVISMSGGDFQTIPINPFQAKGGVYTTSRTLTGITPGGFDIHAVVTGIVKPQATPTSALVPHGLQPANRVPRVQPCTNLNLGPSAQVLSFDDLSVPDVLSLQYSSRGAQFSLSAVTEHPPIPTHSGNTAARSIYDDFGSAGKPIRINFTTLQSAVGMYVGRETPMDHIPIFATLVAYGEDSDGGLVEVARDETVLPPMTIPISRCLLARAPAGQAIRTVVLDYSDEAGNSSYDKRWIDDVTMVAAPGPGTRRPPVVTITQPTPDGVTIGGVVPSILVAHVQESVGLQGVTFSINEGPEQPMGVSLDPDDPSRYLAQASLSGLPYDRYSSLRVRATNSAYLTGDASTHVRWQPPVTGDMWITAFEANQATQTADNTIPLIAFKRTIVRMFVQAREDTRGPWNDVTALLLRRTPGAPERTYAPMNPGETFTLPTAGSNPFSLDDSFYFMLDPEDTSPGRHTFELNLISRRVRPETNTDNNRMTITLNFERPLYLTLYGALWNNQTDPVAPAAPWSDFELHRQYVENTFPVAHFSIIPLPGVGTTPLTFRNLDAARDWGSRMLGHMPDQRLNLLDNWDTCKCGYASDRRSEQQNNRWTMGEVMAQEVAHTMGLWWHTFSDGTPYPRLSGTIGNVRALKTDLAELPPYAAGVQLVNSDRAHPLHDIMSYDNPNWISGFTYCTLMRAISNGTTTCPAGTDSAELRPADEVILNASAMFAPPERTLLAALNPQAAGLSNGGDRNFLLVAGTFLANGTAEFAPFEVLNFDRDVTTMTRGGGYRLTLEDGSGAVLRDYQFDPNTVHLHQGDSIPFGFLMLFDPATKVIHLRQGDKILAERRVSPNPPHVKLGPLPGGELKGQQKISWSGSDADGDALIYALEYSRDSGKSWLPVRVGLKEDSTTLDFDTLPGSDHGVLRVLASDGVNTSEGRSPGEFRVAGKAPHAVAMALAGGSPQGNSLIAAQGPSGGDLLLVSTSWDYEDGAITDGCSWSADGQQFATGPWTTTQKLSAGAHVVTLTVRDSDGNQASTSLNITVPPRPAAERQAPGGPSAK